MNYKICTICNRYFVKMAKAKDSSIRHFGDCNIYSARRRFCSCGLIHDLQYLDFALAKIIYGKYEEDLAIHEGRKKKMSKEEESQCIKILEDIFGKVKPPTLEEIKMDYDNYKKLLKKVWSKGTYPQAFNRLHLWLRNQIKDRH